MSDLIRDAWVLYMIVLPCIALVGIAVLAFFEWRATR